MLRNLRVDGFRSLQDFELYLREDVNVLVGPNGAGKTNILAFFELLSLLTQETVSDSLLRLGGVGANFSIRTSGKQRRPISFFASGETTYNDLASRPQSERRVFYEIEASIVVDSDSGFIYFEKQALRLRLVALEPDLPDLFIDRPAWDLEILHDGTLSPYSEVKIPFMDQDKLDIRTTFALRNRKDEDDIQRVIRTELQREEPIARLFPQFAGSTFPAIREIRRDLLKGRAFNIVPEHVKRREDLSTAPGVHHDGSGLSATLLLLYRLSRRSEQPRPSRLYTHRSVAAGSYFTAGAFGRIVELLTMINPDIQNIEVTVDNDLNYIKVMIVVCGEGGRQIRIPLQQISDGFSKWLAFVTITQTNSELFAIEEPENFLHPHLQRLVLEVIRNGRVVPRRPTFAMITTHSETLINSARPEELIIVSLSEGRTTARRVDDPGAIQEEINSTGFGLSFFYTSESL
ncbi:AAA family ATPase [Inquilinus sp. NPDC058860]|uniref:AAA family ATPase n=1 Tax=Inquilinus sp. NPDC058860 TaxID=3346652 RepID=UPI00368F0260